MAESATAAKARLGGLVLKQRELMADKAQLLMKAADAAEEKSRDWALSVEMRGVHAAKARAARDEARKIAAELE